VGILDQRKMAESHDSGDLLRKRYGCNVRNYGESTDWGRVQNIQCIGKTNLKGGKGRQEERKERNDWCCQVKEPYENQTSRNDKKTNTSSGQEHGTGGKKKED